MRKDIEVICFGVGFGDSIYIKLPNQKQLLIDTGRKTAFSTVVEKLLRDHRNIDYVFLTHSHVDHIGGITQLLENPDLSIRGLFYWAPNDVIISSDNLKKIEKIRDVSTSGRRMIHCEQLNSDVVSRFEGIFGNAVRILYPITFGLHEYRSDDINANSIVIDIIVEGYHMLFMGDATLDNEKLILDDCRSKGIELSKTILWKIGHHGSKGSSGNNFVKTIIGDEFEEAICSCKENWSFDFLRREPPCIERLAAINESLNPYGKSVQFTGFDDQNLI